MSSYQSRADDLEKQAPGALPNLPGLHGIVQADQYNSLVLIYLKQIADLMVEQKELVRKSRNLLWQIDEKLSSSKDDIKDWTKQGDD